MLDKLTTETDATVAVMSLQPLGEQIGSEYNDRVRGYNAMLREEAAERGVAYLPLFESLVPMLGTDAPGRLAAQWLESGSVAPITR